MLTGPLRLTLVSLPVGSHPLAFSKPLHPYRNVQSGHVENFTKVQDMLLVIGVGRREAKGCKVMHLVTQRVSC